MNSKQQAIVESFGRGISVVAGAGCGKTTTLVAKCRELLKRNPKARFCAVSFTEKSVRDLRESLTQNLEGVDLSDHWVKTIHGLCASVIQEFPVAAGLQGGESILVEDEAALLWGRSLEILWTSTDNAAITAALERLLSQYSRESLEKLLLKLRSLKSFGVEEFITRSFHREEVQDLWLVFESVYQRYQQSKNRTGAMDFNDLELLAHRALASPEVRSYFQNRFDLLMVDEFQDTNPLQGAILEAFVKPQFSNLCIVGDPKQSIYRFRDADVSVFQDLTARLPERHLLDENYRSRPDIIDFVNTVCAPAFSASELPYEPLVAGKPAAEDQGVLRLEWEDESILADYLVQEQKRGVDLSEFVILARSVRNAKVQAFISALMDRGIPVLFASGGRFYEDPRVQELVAFLRGWISGKNTLSQVTALRAPWIGVQDEWLYSVGRTSDEGYFKPFFDSFDHPVAQGLREFYLSQERTALIRPGQILSRLLTVEGLDEDLYGSIVMLWHKCEELSRQGRRFEEVVRTFTDAIENEKIEKEIPAPAERGMVRVMTIHGSKGLQFPRVILLDFEGPSRNQSRSGDLIWNRKQGVHLLNRDDSGVQMKDDVENDRWKALEKKSAIAESKRLFYVALTRAQEKLILVWKKDVKASKKSEEPGYDVFLEDHWRGWVESAFLPEGIPTPEKSEAVVIERGARVQSWPILKDFDPKSYRARHSPSEWMILNQCALRYHKKFQSREDLPETANAQKPRYQNGQDHELLESAKNPSTFVAEKGERIHRCIELWDESGLIREFESEALGRGLVLKLKEFLRDGDGIQSFSELGFEVPLSPQEALVGMMDRLEMDEANQTLRVIDYKFTARKESPEKLLSHYALQLKLYAYAASKLSPFKPKAIEGYLVHFTESSFELIQAPSEWFQLGDLEETVQKLYEKSRRNELTATVGDYCRFCEWQSSCPANS